LATLTLRISGKPGTIPVEAFLAAAKYELAILRDLDTAISGNPKRTLDWYIRDLRIGSVEMDVESVSRVAGSDSGLTVSRSIIESINSVERENKTPAYLSESSMKNVEGLISIPKRYHIDGQVSLFSPEENMSAIITDASEQHIKELLPIRNRSIGSVEGRLENIFTHGRPRFTLYESRSRRAITCMFDYDDLISTVKGQLRSRVAVFGVTQSNSRGETLRVLVDKIEPIDEHRQFPGVADIYGIDPDFTNGMSSDEYIRSLRSA